MTSNPYAPPLASVRDIAERHAMNDPADRGTRLGATILDGIIFGDGLRAVDVRHDRRRREGRTGTANRIRCSSLPWG